MRTVTVRIAINAWFLNQPSTGSGQYLQNLLRSIPALAPDLDLLLVAPVAHLDAGNQDLQAKQWPAEPRLLKGNLSKVWFEQVTFPRACRQWQADIAHIPYWGSALWPTLPTIVTVHDLIPLVVPAYRGTRLNRLYTRLVSASAKRATTIITDSMTSKQDIEQHLGIPGERIHCIYLAADHRFSPTPSIGDETIRQLYRLPQRYILYLAGHDIRKNVEGLVEAFAIVAQVDDDVALVIGGRLPKHDSPLFFDPRPLVEALDIDEQVHFIGWVEEEHKAALYRGAKCAFFASHYEGFGLPVLEALACGTPLITSNTSSLPELVGDAGFALDPNNIDGLAGAMLSCLVDDALVAELRMRAPKQAARFSWAQTAQETIDIYREVALCAS